MTFLTRGMMLPLALITLAVAPGCAPKKSADAPAAASPPAAAPAEAPAAAPAEAPAAAPAEAPATTDSGAAAAGAAATTAATSTAEGEKVFKTYCVSCHGNTGKGDGPAAAGLNPKPADFADNMFKYDVDGNGSKGDIADIKAIVHDGAAKHGGSPLMAPWPMISPDQLQSLAEYVKSLHRS